MSYGLTLAYRRSSQAKQTIGTPQGAHGYCSRQLAAEACPYANICEQCDNYVTAPEFIPQLQAQLADITALRDDAAERGWHTEVARHSRVITSIQAHLQRLTRTTETGHTT